MSNAVLDRPASIGNNDRPMEVTLALLADAANRSEEGKLNILGAFTTIQATVFPARHPQMQLVLDLEAAPAEADREKKIEISVMDDDGLEIANFSADITVPPPKSPGQRVHMLLNLRILDMIFPKAGRYQFSVLIDGNEANNFPLTVGGD